MFLFFVGMQALADNMVWPSLTVSQLGGNCFELAGVSGGVYITACSKCRYACLLINLHTCCMVVQHLRN